MKRVFEPARRSLLDVIRKNLRTADRVTYITRIVYIGEYVGSHIDLEKKMESVINDLKADYVNISISGLLLVYPQYYVHVLEASEEIVYKHLEGLYSNQHGDCKLKKAIFLPSHQHVHQRFFTEWFHVYTIPPTLLEKLESHEMTEIQTQVSNCLKKVYTLCDNIGNTVRDFSVPMKDVVRNISGNVARLFPESTVLEYLLNVNCPVLFTAEEFLKVYATVPLVNLYSEYLQYQKNVSLYGVHEICVIYR
ncbi:testis-expressed protein 47-like [Hylaeus volcanicus]|uniref:testis-expressed protein 47-like n=1 Tax=Hylaeus volcanicus TaxID=313075 RepID=UPI0023B8807D|nr:testis-expressed protein 47-like [Hylaeus volcanicus]